MQCCDFGEVVQGDTLSDLKVIYVLSILLFVYITPQCISFYIHLFRLFKWLQKDADYEIVVQPYQPYLARSSIIINAGDNGILIL